MPGQVERMTTYTTCRIRVRIGLHVNRPTRRDNRRTA